MLNLSHKNLNSLSTIQSHGDGIGDNNAVAVPVTASFPDENNFTDA